MPAAVGAVSLAPYCRVIVESAQPRALYQAVSAQRAWLEAWVAAGGILELHGAAFYSDDWSGLPMPGGWSMSWSPGEDVAVVAAGHPIVTWPNAITAAELDGWSNSTHGILVDLPLMSKPVIAKEPAGQPVTADIALRRGCVLATAQPLEWAWIYDLSPILENVILSPCTGRRVYLPVVLRRL